MEISLSSKRKPGFVKGTVPHPIDDPVKSEMWETCDNMVISWLTANLSHVIRKSVIYMSTSKDIWQNLEERFSLTNGSRKYKLNRDVYELKQMSMSINEYYTAMKTIWEELDSLSALPAVTDTTEAITKLLSEIDIQREECKLFQFLNGLNDVYSPQRSQLLLLSPLPGVENASAVLQQEEAQRDMILGHKTEDSDGAAMYSKGPSSYKIYQCTLCGGKGHSNERCWSVVGYPQWHPNYKGNQNNHVVNRFRSSSQAITSSRPRWKSNFRPQGGRYANVAQTSESSSDNALFTPQQLEQLAQLMQLNNLQSSASGGDIPDTPFSGMISCNSAQSLSNDWIIDSGASDHMTHQLSNLQLPVPVTPQTHINLPTGATVNIYHTGIVSLSNNFSLTDVLCVPHFKHNMLSVQNLIKYNDCEVNFVPTHCIILDSKTQTILAVGEARQGMYYLVNTPDPK